MTRNPLTDSADNVERMRRIRTFAQLFQYLVDDQGWPLDLDQPDLPYLEDDDLTVVTYDWDPAELGIPTDRLKDLERFQQMRPLTVNQPWGVFFLEFKGTRLRYTPIRRLLRALVTKKRASAGPVSRRTWALSDLLFFVITGKAKDVELHLLAFKGENPQTAEFRSLTWRPAHTSTHHLKRLSEELLPCLEWPEDTSDTESWRGAWWKAFKLPVGQAINDSARLADRMAKTAQDLRDQIHEALESENGSGPFLDLMQEIRTRLVSDVTSKSFADMCAQTLVYGMLSSRVTNPQDFGSSPIFSTVPLANPFLEALFEQVHDEAVSLDLPGSDLPQLVADLRETNVEAILDQIGSTTKGGDPIIHFYEEFLKKYDREMRTDAGAFYTPQPAVEFIVRAVDEVLRSRFGLRMGIADTESWQEVAERNGFDIPEGIDPRKPFVSMIDPATGTGTFLVEWLRQARKSFLESGTLQEWPRHLRDHLLPSMHAFELMLAPYAIAHLKVALELYHTGANEGTMQILLTDTLEHTARQGQLATMSNPVAEEGTRAVKLKEHERFTVVIGNPPYNREHRSVGDTSKRKGGVVRHGTAGIDPLINAITEPMKEAGLGGHLTNVYNDYVYFWCWAVWQTTELPPGPGIVAFITASSYLEGISMGGVRHLLRNAFDELWIVDLGGEGRGAHKEDNIFDIQTPVTIGVGVRTSQKNTGDCVVRYLKVSGTRSEKLTRLAQTDLNDVHEQIPGEHLDHIVPRSTNQYHDWPKITELLPWGHSGCQHQRTWPIAETKPVLDKRWRAFLEEVPRNRRVLLKETGDRNTHSKVKPLLGGPPRLTPLHDLDRDAPHEGIEQYGYRSFDRQWVIADNRLADRPRPALWKIRGPNQVFLTTLIASKFNQGPVLTVTPYVPDRNHFSNRGANVMPYYRNIHSREPNITQNLLTTLSERLNTEITAEDLLAYVYALGGTSAFTDRFNEELAETAGPIHIPITANPDLFQQAIKLGRDLLWWHTWGERFTPEGQLRLPEGQAKKIRPVEVMPNNSKDRTYDRTSRTLTVGTGTFAPVSEEAWNFEVSGLRVLRSWLGYRMKKRKGIKSSPLDYIRPTRWTQTKELLLVLSILEHTIEVTPKAAELLEKIVSGPLIPAKDLPTPTPAQRKPPKL
ncbi:MAG: hypothetical protein OXI96_03575 [Acidimicrobiaceae bacterium]|nr:hypothetical protein [Acidimicrobiaceae bacterium]